MYISEMHNLDTVTSDNKITPDYNLNKCIVCKAALKWYVL